MVRPNIRSYLIQVVIRRASDRSVWIAHCLDFDVFGEGATPGEASADLDEPVDFVVIADLAAGLDPLDRRAPDEFWSEVDRIRRVGRQVALDELPADPDGVQVVLAVRNRSYVQDELGRWTAPESQVASGMPGPMATNGNQRVA